MENKSVVQDGGKETGITEALGFGMLMAAIGGFMDAYSYIVHGNVFATGQTGNFVLAALRLAEQDFMGMGHAMVPIAAFWIGIFAAQHLRFIVKKKRVQKKHVNWKAGVLFGEMTVLFAVGLLPPAAPDILANTGIAFSAAMQFSSFKNIGKNAAYATIFCTGNMRSCAEMFYKGIIRKDKDSMKKAFHYTAILLAFFSGAIFGAVNSGIYREKAIWAVCVLLGLALFVLHKFKQQGTGPYPRNT